MCPARNGCWRNNRQLTKGEIAGWFMYVVHLYKIWQIKPLPYRRIVANKTVALWTNRVNQTRLKSQL